MNRRIFANLILYDIRKGFRENKIKWIVGVFIFVFFSFITVSDFSVNSPELGFLAYFTNILQGMPPYIKTDDSVFTIPVSWFLFYAFLFFMVGFYPLSDLYGAGKKTLILSGSRFKWLWSKYIWTVINVIMYYAAMILVLEAVTCAIGKWSTKPDDMLMEMGIDMQQFATGNEVLVWLILPTGRSAVKAMSEIVLRKVILHTVDRELTLIDTVGIASDSCAEIALMILRIIILNIVKSKDNITPYTVLVGNQNRSDTTTEIGYIHLHTGLVFQTVDFVAILLRRRASHCSKGAYTHCNRN